MASKSLVVRGIHVFLCPNAASFCPGQSRVISSTSRSESGHSRFSAMSICTSLQPRYTTCTRDCKHSHYTRTCSRLSAQSTQTYFPIRHLQTPQVSLPPGAHQIGQGVEHTILLLLDNIGRHQQTQAPLRTRVFLARCKFLVSVRLQLLRQSDTIIDNTTGTHRGTSSQKEGRTRAASCNGTKRSYDDSSTCDRRIVGGELNEDGVVCVVQDGDVGAHLS